LVINQQSSIHIFKAYKSLLFLANSQITSIKLLITNQYWKSLIIYYQYTQIINYQSTFKIIVYHQWAWLVPFINSQINIKNQWSSIINEITVTDHKFINHQLKLNINNNFIHWPISKLLIINLQSLIGLCMHKSFIGIKGYYCSLIHQSFINIINHIDYLSSIINRPIHKSLTSITGYYFDFRYQFFFSF
jgi:hypothetical protein